MAITGKVQVSVIPFREREFGISSERRVNKGHMCFHFFGVSPISPAINNYSHSV
jgi:hypothetical protein